VECREFPEEPGPVRRRVAENRSLCRSSAGQSVIFLNAKAEAFRASKGMEASRIQVNMFRSGA